MPDKNRCCSSSSCIRCWRNQLKHGNKETKAWMKKNNVKKIEVITPDKDEKPLKKFKPVVDGNNVSEFYRLINDLEEEKEL